jgi:transcriptional regulator with XRE-family HTH domain
MSFGKRLLEARKKKGISQEEVADKLGTKGPVIGRYERDEAAAKMADLLEVSLDWLCGTTDQNIDKKTLTRVLELQKLPIELKDKLYYFIDMSIRDFKAAQAYSNK